MTQLDANIGKPHAQISLAEMSPQHKAIREAVQQYEAAVAVGTPDTATTNRMIHQARTLDGTAPADLVLFLTWFDDKFAAICDVLLSTVRAYTLLALERYEDADACARQILEEVPHRFHAMHIQIRVADAQGDRGKALDLLEDAIERYPNAELLLRYSAKLMKDVGIHADAAKYLDRIPKPSGAQFHKLAADRIQAHFDAGNDASAIAICAELSEELRPKPFLANRLSSIVASAINQNRPAVAAAALAALLKFEVLPEAVVNQLIGLATRAGDPSLVGRVASRAKSKRSANDLNRTRIIGIAKRLMSEGRCDLAARYLRRCQRQWPQMDAVWNMGVREALECGALDMAHTMIDALARQAPPDKRAMILWLRGDVLTMAGRLEEAEQCLAAIDTSTAAHGVLQRRLRILVVLGRFEEAEDIARKLRTRLGNTARASMQFNVTLFGGDLNERRIQSVAERCLPEGLTAPERRLKLARNFFFPASEIVTEALSNNAFGKAVPDGNIIPQRIMQYWDVSEVPPEVARHVRTWQCIPGFEHVLLSERTAVAWLGSTFDLDHARAFRLAKQPAQKADFLRLCWIAHEGGIYVDADDRLRGSIENVLSWANGSLFFREPLRSIANNFIAARPQHPVMCRARSWALKSLLTGENDRTWAKTGPGLLTRAVALTLREEPQEALDRDVRILPLHRLQTEVSLTLPLPHKQTSKHWNAPVRGAAPKSKPTPADVVETLARWAAQSPAEAPPREPRATECQPVTDDEAPY